MSISSVGGSSLLQQMQQALFTKADANGDGQLSSAEFLSIGQNLPPPGNGGSAKPMKGGEVAGGNFSSATMGSLLSAQQDRTDRLTKLFNGADANGDGQVTAEELAANLASGANASTTASTTDLSAKAASLIKAGDTNGDGALSLSEFQAMAPPGRGHHNDGDGDDQKAAAASVSTASTSTPTSYDPADTNKDGKVSMTELLASLQSSQGSISGFSSEASDLLSKLLTSLASNTTASPTTSTVSQTA